MMPIEDGALYSSLGVLAQYFHSGRSRITACLGRDIFIRSHLTVGQVITQLPY